MIDVLVVVFHPDTTQLKALLDSVLQANQAGVPLAMRVWHNDGDAPVSGEVYALYRDIQQRGLSLTIGGGEGNLGFGSGINRLLKDSTADYVLALNQDAIPEDGALAELWKYAAGDDAKVAAWEMRQIPFEHPKNYDPVSLDTEWVSGAAVLLRASAMREVGGFEPRIFMYGEDVDLSWRLRCAGYRLRYVARAAVVHHTYSKAHEVKPLQALGSIYVNLCLRARYAGRRQIAQGLSMAFAEMMLPESFPGRRLGIAKAILRFMRNYSYFWASHKGAPGFEPRFAGWGYEVRRDGAFHSFVPRDQQPKDLPVISVLIRTHKRAAFLRQALTSVLHQTHRPIEVVVVEDGSDEGQAVCNEFADRLDVRYFRITPGRGRSVAGNRALQEARGEWMCFLDDDDLFFADHLEVLLQTVREAQLKGAFALSWRTTTQVIDASIPTYNEVRLDSVPDEPFSRVTLWHHNFMPIQAVLFHRSLFERYGGFAEDMHQLEDWNLWTRYTMQDDFVQVRKTTSKYRVPAEVSHTLERQGKLDDAYKDAVARQGQMKFNADPAFVRKLAEDYVRSNALIHVGRDQVRARFASSPMLARLATLRHVLRRRFS
ncbi:MAG: glycosyltransferase [Rhizobacter sp.]|nr:glycosyltransferase [Burkholderiales bacterium]